MLKSEYLHLRSLESDDINKTYLDWLNDFLVNQYLETRFLPQTMESLREYWSAQRDDPRSPWFAICLNSDDRHIGNIKLGPIDVLHRRADLSLFIGDRESWGKGYATEAIMLISSWSFSVLDLQKLNAGIYSSNVASKRAFEKSGFILEGTLKEEVFSAGNRIDVLRMGLTRGKWNSGFQ